MNIKITDNLTTMERRIAIAAIKRFGTGQHPEADEDTLPYFETDYVVQCLQEAIPHLVVFHARIARRALAKLTGKYG